MQDDTLAVNTPFIASSQVVRLDGTSFWDYLMACKIPYSKADFPLLTNHQIPRVKCIFDFEEYTRLGSRGAALAYLYQGLGKTLNYVGPVLDQELEHGFNDHTDRHTLWVSQTGVELIQRSGFSFDNLNDYYGPRTEVLMTLVGMLHDLGNLIDRKGHSTYSAWLLTRLFSNTQKDADFWHAVLYAILYHEEPVLNQTGVHLHQGLPLQWALVLADKMHVGRDRIGNRSVESGIKNDALEKDAHILLNALIVRSTWFLSRNTFVWHLGFSVEQLEQKFQAFTNGNKRIWVPHFFQRMLEYKGVTYRESFISLFNQLYGDRMRMAAEAAFLLFPYIDRFEVRLGDIDTRGKVGSGENHVWQTWRTQFDLHKQTDIGAAALDPSIRKENAREALELMRAGR